MNIDDMPPGRVQLTDDNDVSMLMTKDRQHQLVMAKQYQDKDCPECHKRRMKQRQYTTEEELRLAQKQANIIADCSSLANHATLLAKIVQGMNEQYLNTADDQINAIFMAIATLKKDVTAYKRSLTTATNKRIKQIQERALSKGVAKEIRTEIYNGQVIDGRTNFYHPSTGRKLV